MLLIAKAEADLKNQKKLDNFAGGIAAKMGMQTSSLIQNLVSLRYWLRTHKKCQMDKTFCTTLMGDFLSFANLSAAALSFMYESVVAVALSLESANAQFQKSNRLLLVILKDNCRILLSRCCFRCHS